MRLLLSNNKHVGTKIGWKHGTNSNQLYRPEARPHRLTRTRKDKGTYKCELWFETPRGLSSNAPGASGSRKITRTLTSLSSGKVKENHVVLELREARSIYAVGGGPRN
jgi:hypothetical protein